jgi:hypothetical protein
MVAGRGLPETCVMAPRRLGFHCCRHGLALTLALVGLLTPRTASAGERYDLQGLNEPQAPVAMARCLGQDIDAGQLRGFLREALLQTDPTHALQFRGPQSPAVVLAAGGRWACVPLSAQGFPRWPLEAMHGVIVPVGVPAELTAAWRRSLLEQVALDGVGRGLVVYPSGDADQVIVIAEQGQALHLKLTRRLLRAGDYREDQFPAVLRHPGLKRLVTRSMGPGEGTPKRLAIPPQRLMQPVDDGFVRVEPSAPTRSFAFGGTRWVLPGAGHRIELRTDGQALRIGDGAPEPGTWRVADGVLRVAWSGGTRHALALQPGGATLTGMGRRAETESHDEEGDEWQWRTQWRLEGTDGARGSMRVAALRGPA